jgi:S-(hydroxymethyl)glutathione dehydrogenase/alcohol dehydrogenase
VKTRAAVLFESPGRYEVHDVDLDPPTDDEVLVRMVASGLCHSDLHLMTGDQPALSPMCPGHERAGIVEKVGRSVVGLCRGDHVVTSFIPSCGHCRYCAARKPTCVIWGRSWRSAHSWMGPIGCISMDATCTSS